MKFYQKSYTRLRRPRFLVTLRDSIYRLRSEGKWAKAGNYSGAAEYCDERKFQLGYSLKHIAQIIPLRHGVSVGNVWTAHKVAVNNADLSKPVFEFQNGQFRPHDIVEWAIGQPVNLPGLVTCLYLNPDGKAGVTSCTGPDEFLISCESEDKPQRTRCL